MSWLKLDDGVSISGKLAQLNDRERRILGDGLWAYCAREKNDGYFDERELRHAFYLGGHKTYRCTVSHLHRFVELGLVDDLGDGQYKVHNWEVYQPRDPTAAERKRRQRAKQQRDSHGVTDRDASHRDEPGHVRAFPSRPVPNTSLSQDLERKSERETIDEQEQARQAAWHDRAAKPDVRSPQAFIAAGIRGGGWPDPYVPAANGTARAIENGSGSGPAYIAGLIRNGVLTDRADLETELDLAGVEDADRSSLVAQLQLAQQLEGRE